MDEAMTCERNCDGWLGFGQWDESESTVSRGEEFEQIHRCTICIGENKTGQ